jgi:ankyrin repeat protein
MKHILLTTIAAVLVSCDWGPSTIHQAANQGNNEAVKRYLEAGTDVSAKNKSGDRESTLLHYAADRGHKETSELLIAEGADLLRKHGGKTGGELKAEGK